MLCQGSQQPWYDFEEKISTKNHVSIMTREKFKTHLPSGFYHNNLLPLL